MSVRSSLRLFQAEWSQGDLRQVHYFFAHVCKWHPGYVCPSPCQQWRWCWLSISLLLFVKTGVTLAFLQSSNTSPILCSLSEMIEFGSHFCQLPQHSWVHPAAAHGSVCVKFTLMISEQILLDKSQVSLSPDSLPFPQTLLSPWFGIPKGQSSPWRLKQRWHAFIQLQFHILHSLPSATDTLKAALLVLDSCHQI